MQASSSKVKEQKWSYTTLQRSPTDEMGITVENILVTLELLRGFIESTLGW